MIRRIQNDVFLYRMVVAMPGVTVVASVLAAIVLAMTGRSTSEVLMALGSAAVGVLAGLLAPHPYTDSC